MGRQILNVLIHRCHTSILLSVLIGLSWSLLKEPIYVVKTEIGEMAQLVGDFCYEIEGSHVVSMDSASLGSEEELVMSGAHTGVERGGARDRAHELTFLVKDQDLSVGA
jgi:hypothetical protein